MVHPTNRKWVNQPQLFQWDKWGQRPLMTGVVTHLRFVGSSPPSTRWRQKLLTLQWFGRSCSERARGIHIFPWYSPIQWGAVWSYFEFPNHLIVDLFKFPWKNPRLVSSMSPRQPKTRMHIQEIPDLSTSIPWHVLNYTPKMVNWPPLSCKLFYNPDHFLGVIPK